MSEPRVTAAEVERLIREGVLKPIWRRAFRRLRRWGYL